MASAGSNVSKRYKRLASKLGVKHKVPGALIQASRKHKSVKRKITKHSMDYVAPLKSAAKGAAGAARATQGYIQKTIPKNGGFNQSKITPEQIKRLANSVKGIGEGFGKQGRQVINRVKNDRQIEASRVRGPRENLRRAGQAIGRGVGLVSRAIRSAPRPKPSQLIAGLPRPKPRGRKPRIPGRPGLGAYTGLHGNVTRRKSVKRKK